MRDFKKIGLAMAVTSAMAMTSVALADAAGDSLIYLPANNSTITDASGANTDIADVWFVKDDTAMAYSITLVSLAGKSDDGDDTAIATTECGTGMTAALADDTLILESSLVMANAVSCPEESQLTKTGGDSTLAAVSTPVKLCNWTSNMLAPGNYAVAINPIHVGDAIQSGPEKIDATASCGDDTDVHLDNTAIDFTAATDGNFQLFTVAEPTTPSVISQPPEAPVLVGPIGEFKANDSATPPDPGMFTFDDVSPDEGEATWYKIYIQHPNGSRVTVNGDNWFKLLFDPQLTCSATTPSATGQKRTCTIDLTEDEVTGDLGTDTSATGLEYTYWIRGYNGDSGGATGPWSAAGKFKHETDDEQ